MRFIKAIFGQVFERVKRTLNELSASPDIEAFKNLKLTIIR